MKTGTLDNSTPTREPELQGGNKLTQDLSPVRAAGAETIPASQLRELLLLSPNDKHLRDRYLAKRTTELREMDKNSEGRLGRAVGRALIIGLAVGILVGVMSRWIGNEGWAAAFGAVATALAIGGLVTRLCPSSNAEVPEFILGALSGVAFGQWATDMRGPFTGVIAAALPSVLLALSFVGMFTILRQRTLDKHGPSAPFSTSEGLPLFVCLVGVVLTWAMSYVLVVLVLPSF